MKRILPFIIPIVFLILLELTMAGLNQIMPWDEYIYRLGLKHSEFLGNPESQNFFWFLRDPDLFWKMKPGENVQGLYINKLGFRGKEINPVKEFNSTRIVCLGNSCTFGNEVIPQFTFAARLETKLNQTHPVKKFEVVNAGVSGYSTFQMLRNWRKNILKLDPDIITLYAAQNDLIYAPYKEDKDIQIPKSFCNVSNFLFSFRVCRALNSVIRCVGKIFSGKEFITPYNEKTGILRRVSPNDYRQNLATMAQEMQKNNIKLIFVTSPIIGYIPFTPYPYPEIINVKGDKYIHWIAQERVKDGWIKRYTALKELNSVIELEKRKITTQPSWPASYFKIGFCYQQMGDSLKAVSYFRQADSLDVTRKDMQQYNQIMREVAAEFQVPLLDMAAIIGNGKNSQYFAQDGFHPNNAGHTLIAEELYKVVDDIIKTDSTLTQ